MKLPRYFLSCLVAFSCAAFTQPGTADELPAPESFDASRYAGKWFELARLPSQTQPKGTLAIAGYALDANSDHVKVKNTAYTSDGKKIRSSEGKAVMVQNGSKGRLSVSFGGPAPAEPNYCIIKLDDDYQYAVVGSPNMKSLWILAREVPMAYKDLEALVIFANENGFDTSKLEVAQWPEKFSKNYLQFAGDWTLSMEGPNGETIEFPMELELSHDNALTGRVGRGDGRWLKLKKGKVDGDTFSFIIERDRPEGGAMTYQMSGSLKGDSIDGEAKTDFNGQEITNAWEAKRVK